MGHTGWEHNNRVEIFQTVSVHVWSTDLSGAGWTGGRKVKREKSLLFHCHTHKPSHFHHPLPCNSPSHDMRCTFDFEELRSIKGKKEMIPTCMICKRALEELGCRLKMRCETETWWQRGIRHIFWFLLKTLSRFCSSRCIWSLVSLLFFFFLYLKLV